MSSLFCNIAIVGVGARLPGNVCSKGDFWELLASGQDGISEVPESRWNTDKFRHELRSAPGKSCTFSGGIIDNIEFFDRDFFSISEREAQSMDPQQTLLLELVWEMFEDAHSKPSRYAASDTGVFIGASSVDASLSASDDPSAMGPYSMTGSSLSIISNRISYLYDLQGPSMTLDTACSSSLIALHEACTFLVKGDGRAAIAGGVNCLYSPLPYIGFSKAQMLSENGRCKVFDQSGDGYVRSEGAVVYLLKRLEDAELDGDHIHGVIRATGCNAGGITDVGISFPNIEGQKRLLAEIYGVDSDQKIDPQTLSYLEAHGTGTPVGDPVELGALGAVIGKNRSTTTPLMVGSVKSSIGHLEPASGAAGLLKSLSILQHKIIPPNIHLQDPLNSVDFDELNLFPVAASRSLPETIGLGRIGINSFGFGGTNAHVLVEEYSRAEEQSVEYVDSDLKASLDTLFLSARSKTSLQEMARNFRSLLQENPVEDWPSIAAQLVFEREEMEYRLAVPLCNENETFSCLKQFAEEGTTSGRLIYGHCQQKNSQTAFVYSGNGAQWAGMGHSLYVSNLVFKQSLDDLDRILAPLMGWSVVEEICKGDQQRIDKTEISQPLLFAYQVGLTDLFRSVGIVPTVIYGHSVGEVAAAYACGALSLEVACEVIVKRSLIQARSYGLGKMAVAKCSFEYAQKLKEVIQGSVIVAGHNSPDFVTFSGETAALERIEEQFNQNKVIFKMLSLEYPFHSALMDPFKEDFFASIGPVEYSIPEIPFISTHTGKMAEDNSFDATYWWDNIREMVRFHEATETALEAGITTFVEIGPHNILRSFLNNSIKKSQYKAKVLPTMKKGEDTDVDWQRAWNNAYCQGININFDAFVEPPVKRITLPHYAWNKVDCGLPKTSKNMQLFKTKASHPLLGYRKDGELYVWENSLDSVLFPYLGDHVVYGDPILPGAAIIEIVLAAATEIYEQVQQEIIDLTLLRPVPIGISPATDIRLTISKIDGSFTLESRTLLSDEQWTINATGITSLKVDSCEKLPNIDVTEIINSGTLVDRDDLYQGARNAGLQYGPQFRPIQHLWLTESAGLTIFRDMEDTLPKHMLIQPQLLDGAFQILFALLPKIAGETLEDAFIPMWFGRVRLFQPGIATYGRTQIQKISSHSAVASFELMDAEGNVLCRLDECRFKKMKMSVSKRQRSFSTHLVPIVHADKTPDPTFPCNKKLIDSIRPRLDKLFFEFERGTYYDEFKPLSQALLVSHLGTYVQQIFAQQEVVSLDDIENSPHIEAHFVSYMVYVFDLLASKNIVDKATDKWIFKPDFALSSASDIWRDLVDNYPSYLAAIVILGKKQKCLGDIISGALSFDDVFSSQPGSILESYQLLSPEVRYQNSIITEVVKKLHQLMPAGTHLEVLEMGVGTGGLLHSLASSLPAEKVKFMGVDSDAHLINKLESSNREYKNIQFQCVDFNKELPEDFREKTFDLILAIQSLQHLNDMSTGLDNCYQLLAPGGLLLVVEKVPDTFTDLLYGLQKYWWDFSESNADPSSHSLSADYCLSKLSTAGFEDIYQVKEKDNYSGDNSIIVARKPAKVCEQVSVVPELIKNENTLWLILEDAQPTEVACELRDGLVERLQQQSIAYKVIPCAAEPSAKESGILDYTSVDEWKALLEQAVIDGYVIKIAHLIGFDTDSNLEPEPFQRILLSRVLSGTMLAKALTVLADEVELFFICGGALGQEETTFQAVPSQAGLWGAAKVICNELAGVQVRCIDINFKVSDHSLFDDLLLELMTPQDDIEVVLDQGQRLVPRLAPLERMIFENDPHVDKLSNISLKFDMPGIDNLYWQQDAVQTPADDEVCLRIRATGLNFRDVMFTMGVLPVEALEDGATGPALGLECSGEIVSVGRDVTDFQIGDEVMCMVGPCFSSYHCVKQTFLFPKPANVSFQEAATLPVAFATSYYALKELARVEPGDKVLIHSAAGGVGLAALQVANHLGAEVYATAGSKEKRDMLRLMGVKHVFNSHSLQFFDDIKEMTGGEGVDVVLNSLAGETLFKSIKLLKPFGRFLELGKRDFYSNTPLRMHMLRNNISFFAIDLDSLLAYKPLLAKRIFADLLELFQSEELKPLIHTVYSRANTVHAFRDMQRGKHVGKLIVEFDELHNKVRTQPAVQYGESLDPNASYIVTGGLAGLGLSTAFRLQQNGARYLILISRSGSNREEAQIGVQQLEALGVTVHVVQADVSDFDRMQEVFNVDLAGIPPLKGIVHSAAVLDDSTISNIEPEQISNSLLAKAIGAWNLHKLTQSMDLYFFTMFSSVTTVLGNPGQVNYVAANTVLESLARYRRAQGLAALTYGWGPIADTGMLTRAPEVLASLKQVMRISELRAEQALDFMDNSPSGCYANLFYFNLDWSRVKQLNYLKSTFFDWVDEVHNSASRSVEEIHSIREIMSMPHDEAIKHIALSLRQEIALSMKISVDSIEDSTPITDIGVDSLMAVELGLWIEHTYGVKESAFSMSVSSTVLSIAEKIEKSFSARQAESKEELEVKEILDVMKEKHGIAYDENKVKQALTEVGE